MGNRSEIWTVIGSWFTQIIDGVDAQLCMGHWRVFVLLGQPEISGWPIFIGIL